MHVQPVEFRVRRRRGQRVFEPGDRDVAADVCGGQRHRPGAGNPTFTGNETGSLSRLYQAGTLTGGVYANARLVPS
ncbi:MAG: hypothetical protein L0215_18450 [Gemmataceae bacterium]|nr:hypothetical protein [Gemmataceae bacterium]